MSKNDPAERTVRDIRRKTRKQYTADPGGVGPHRRLVPPRGLAEGLYYSWSKEFLEAGKKRLAGDTGRATRLKPMRDLKELVAELSLENRLLKKNMIGHGGGYPASENYIRLVEQSHLGSGPLKLGIPKTTFYRWYDRFLVATPVLRIATAARGCGTGSRPGAEDLALEETQSPRELAVRFTDTRGYFVSGLGLLKFTSPAFVVQAR